MSSSSQWLAGDRASKPRIEDTTGALRCTSSDMIDQNLPIPIMMLTETYGCKTEAASSSRFGFDCPAVVNPTSPTIPDNSRRVHVRY